MKEPYRSSSSVLPQDTCQAHWGCWAWRTSKEDSLLSSCFSWSPPATHRPNLTAAEIPPQKIYLGKYWPATGSHKRREPCENQVIATHSHGPGATSRDIDIGCGQVYKYQNAYSVTGGQKNPWASLVPLGLPRDKVDVHERCGQANSWLKHRTFAETDFSSPNPSEHNSAVKCFMVACHFDTHSSYLGREPPLRKLLQQLVLQASL